MIPIPGLSEWPWYHFGGATTKPLLQHLDSSYANDLRLRPNVVVDVSASATLHIQLVYKFP